MKKYVNLAAYPIGIYMLMSAYIICTLVFALNNSVS
jgi:hypothetical protein